MTKREIREMDRARRKPRPRKTISKKTRFDVFERDRFQCRYCGKTPEDGALMELDHIVPHSKGGSDEPENLATACKDCNAGKSDRELGALPATDRMRLLQERMEVEAVAKEAALINDLKSGVRQALCDAFCAATGQSEVKRSTLSHMMRLTQEFGFKAVSDWIEIAASQTHTETHAIKYLYGIARNNREA